MAKAADREQPHENRRNSAGYKGIIDMPFPAYESVPREELKAACAWEIDREFLDEQSDPHRPWPKLLAFERTEIAACVGQPVLNEECPPAAASLYPPDSLLEDKHSHREACVMGLSAKEWYRFHCNFASRRLKGMPLTNDDPEYWKHLEDEQGRLRIVFAIDKERPLEDVLDDMRRELLRLHRFPPKKQPTRDVDWASRLCDLLCLRLERMGISWQDAFKVLSGYRKANSLGGLTSQKDWSTRRGRAKKAIEERRAVLANRVRHQVEYDEEKYGCPQPPESIDSLWLWGLQGWQGPRQPIGMEKPHELMSDVMGAQLGEKAAFDHFLSMRGLTRQSEGVEWASVWFEFESWKEDDRSEYGRFVREAWEATRRTAAQAAQNAPPLNPPPDD